jgi:hypothetical protein
MDTGFMGSGLSMEKMPYRPYHIETKHTPISISKSIETGYKLSPAIKCRKIRKKATDEFIQ